MAITLFDKYGGFSVFQGIVREFYVKVLDSEQLRGHFSGIHMERLIDHQSHFLSRLLGGPEDQYADVDLVRTHQHLHITDEQFSEIAELLAETLDDFNVEEKDLSTIMGAVSGFKDQIVHA